MLISGLFLGLLLYGLSFALNHQNRVKANTDEVTFIPSGDGRHFYLTNTTHFPDEALTACASGYHMASLWEILDVSNLSYDYDHPNAHTKDDSGFGPPSYWNGWVRTGWSSSTSTTTGTGNCQNWSSRSGSDSGVSVRLSRLWETARATFLPGMPPPFHVISLVPFGAWGIFMRCSCQSS
ncbi:MAG: hypothetical protein M5U34_08015 [Chloroflexi bacterium]|nr:hypothetical protein [Chloroflexota bacterium]